MMTPQEVSQHAFAKASFGGYNMAMVDEFLDVLTEDYSALYRENAVLKSKMKVLVEKVEEYRSTEDAMRKALLTAQRMADEMVQDAQRKQAELLAQAEAEARKKVEALRQEVESEQLRLTAAQSSTAAYVGKLKELYQHEMEYLGGLSQLSAPAPAADPVDAAVSDIDASIHKLMEEKPAEDLEDTKELEPVTTHAGGESGGLYGDLTGYSAAQAEAEKPGEKSGAPEEPAAQREEAPARHLDFKDLEHHFGKDYEIK